MLRLSIMKICRKTINDAAAQQQDYNSLTIGSSLKMRALFVRKYYTDHKDERGKMLRILLKR